MMFCCVLMVALMVWGCYILQVLLGLLLFVACLRGFITFDFAWCLILFKLDLRLLF